MNFLSWLCLLFIALKLTGHIDWNWIFVLLPGVLALAGGFIPGVNKLVK